MGMRGPAAIGEMDHKQLCKTHSEGVEADGSKLATVHLLWSTPPV